MKWNINEFKILIFKIAVLVSEKLSFDRKIISSYPKKVPFKFCKISLV